MPPKLLVVSSIGIVGFGGKVGFDATPTSGPYC
jgi:hypothetical protein